MPVLPDHRKTLTTLRRVNFIAVVAALLCVAGVVIVLVDRTLWTTALVLVAAGAVLAYQGKETA